MDSDYPPLPPPDARGHPVPLSPSHDMTKATSSEPRHDGPGANAQNGTGSSRKAQSVMKVLSRDPDVVIDYTDSAEVPAISHQWQIASVDLMRNSPYFRALLNPNKFSEGRSLLKQRNDVALERRAEFHETPLPQVSLSVDHVTRRLGADAIELFLKILSFNPRANEEREGFESELRSQPTSLVARTIELADVFNSPQAVCSTLKKSAYSYGRGKAKFNPPLLKMNEDRIRQIIFIAGFLNEPTLHQVMTHTLILGGSRFWANGVESPVSDTFRWRYLSGGLEEELYYRRQCVLNTITDLQAYFLRAYGALEEPEPPASPTLTPVVPTRTRQLQCRWGFGNSSVCDAFHLGQMTRFFTLRTKTVFLGSSLIDPDFSVDPRQDHGYDTDHAIQPHQGPPADITSIIASLKQIPDYQIDSNHTGCGVRRRIVPTLDSIEKFVADGRGLLGVLPARIAPLASSSWTNPSQQRAQAVDVRSSRIMAIHPPSQSTRLGSSQEGDARLLFTARKRNWEA